MIEESASAREGVHLAVCSTAIIVAVGGTNMQSGIEVSHCSVEYGPMTGGFSAVHPSLFRSEDSEAALWYQEREIPLCGQCRPKGLRLVTR